MDSLLLSSEARIAAAPALSPSGFILECSGLKKDYRTGKVVTTVLREASLSMTRSEFVLITGESGSGKSTLLKLIGCLDRPTDGAIRLFGDDVTQMSDRRLTDLRRDKLSFIFQELNLLPVMTALENVLYPLRRKSEPGAVEFATRLLQQVGLGQRLHAKPQKMSGGEQQRTAVARSFAQRPQLILADEPTGALDSENTTAVFKLLRAFCDAGEGSVLLVSHDPQARKWADRIFTVTDGRLAPS